MITIDRPTRRASNSADALVAAYVHEISERHHVGVPPTSTIAPSSVAFGTWRRRPSAVRRTVTAAPTSTTRPRTTGVAAS